MLAASLGLLLVLSPDPPPTASPRVLVFSKTAAFRHDSIPHGIEAIREMGRSRNWSVEITEDAAVFEPDRLRRFACVVFLLTTGDVLNAAQQSAFESYVEAGGGYAGLHAAADTEYDWPWYGSTCGAYFKNHPAIQPATIRIEDAKHPSTSFLPKSWTRTDEWYNYRTNPRSAVRVLATLDESTYRGGEMGKDHPIVWCRALGKGRSWYSGLGHTKESYAEPLFLRHLAEGIVWAGRLHEKPVWDR